MMYAEQERAVFPYFDGYSHRYGDPLAIDRRLTIALGGRPDAALAKYHEDASTQEEVLRAARLALEMVPFDPATGSGALDVDVETALRAFLGYLEGKGQRAVNSPTSSRPIQDSPPSSSPPASVTWIGSGSGSTSTDPRPEPPGS